MTAIHIQVSHAFHQQPEDIFEGIFTEKTPNYSK